MSVPTTKQVQELRDRARPISYGIVQPGPAVADGVPIVRVNNFTGDGLDISNVLRVSPTIEAQYQRSRPKGGDVLVSLVGSIGQVAIAPPEIEGWNLARAVGIIPTADDHHSYWISYALRAPDAQAFIHRHANTTVQATFNLKDLASLPIPYPPRAVREAALSVLVPLDRKIELNRRMNETLEAMAQAIFRDWFVDFGPVRRKLAGATDPVEIMGGVAPDTEWARKLSALFPNDLDAEGTPQGWKVSNLGALAEAVGEGVAPSAIQPETSYIGLEHMPRRSIALETWETAAKISSQKARFQRGQILFGKLRPYFHKVGIAPTDGVCSTDIVVLDSRKSFDRALVASCVSSDAFVAFTDQASTGTKMPRTSWGQMRSYALAIADEPARMAFSAIVGPMHDKIIASIAENRTLAETRDYLLPRLMSGEVRVGDAAKEIAA